MCGVETIRKGGFARTMTSRTNLFKALGYLWLVASGLFILIGVVGVWISEGISEIPGHLSPFEAVNWIVLIIAVMPGVSLLLLAARIREQAGDTHGVIRAYRAVLESAVDALVVDEDRLPAPKHAIKAAILEVLRDARDPKMRGFLQNAYIELAMFQPGVGPEPIALALSPTPSRGGYKGVVAVVRSNAERNPEIKRWSGTIAKEGEQLLDEMRSAGLGLDAKVDDKRAD